MNYKQALEASKNNPAPVMKVLERLGWECPACAGTAIGVKRVEVEGKERHKWIDKGCPKCKNGKIPYSYTPQVGEWCIWDGFKDISLIYEVREAKWLKLPGCGHELPKENVTPILEWQEIERILEEAGYWLEVKKPLKKYIHKGWMKVSASIYEDIGKNAAGNGKYIAYATAKSCKEAVDLAVIELGKEMRE